MKDPFFGGLQKVRVVSSVFPGLDFAKKKALQLFKASPGAGKCQLDCMNLIPEKKSLWGMITRPEIAVNYEGTDRLKR